MSNRVISVHPLDEPGLVIEGMQEAAPRGWFSWHAFASVAPPPPLPPKKRKKGKQNKADKYLELMAIMAAARRDDPKHRKYWESGQVLRGYDPVPPGEMSAPYIWDRDDRRNFASVPAILAELRRVLPEATSITVVWMIHPPYLEEDLRRDGIALPKPTRGGGTFEALFRELVRTAIKADPLWVPDYPMLAGLFPTLAPREKPDGTPIGDRMRTLRLIVSEERRAAGVPVPPPPVSARARLFELFGEGRSRDEAAALLKLGGWDVTSEYVTTVLREWRAATAPLPVIEIEVEPGVGPVEISVPIRVDIIHRPAPMADPIGVREARELPADASTETTVRELLRRGATYAEVRKTLLEEKRRIVPDASLRRMATEIRKADEVRPIEEARSRSDVARALIRDGLSYDQIDAAFAERGQRSLSRGQLRAIKANLKA